jgi:hypothetical protein
MNKSSFLITVVTLFVLPVALAQSDKSITIHQEIDFNASPQRLYEALLDANQFTAFSGRPAEMKHLGLMPYAHGHMPNTTARLVRTCALPRALVVLPERKSWKTALE